MTLLFLRLCQRIDYLFALAHLQARQQTLWWLRNIRDIQFKSLREGHITWDSSDITQYILADVTWLNVCVTITAIFRKKRQIKVERRTSICGYLNETWTERIKRTLNRNSRNEILNNITLHYAYSRTNEKKKCRRKGKIRTNGNSSETSSDMTWCELSKNRLHWNMNIKSLPFFILSLERSRMSPKKHKCIHARRELLSCQEIKDMCGCTERMLVTTAYNTNWVLSYPR